jgi:hypothetical protein
VVLSNEDGPSEADTQQDRNKHKHRGQEHECDQRKSHVNDTLYMTADRLVAAIKPRPRGNCLVGINSWSALESGCFKSLAGYARAVTHFTHETYRDYQSRPATVTNG